MDINKPLEHVNELFLADSSKKAYHNLWNKWMRHCGIKGVKPLPVCPYELEEFLEEYVHLCKNSTFKLFIKSLSAVHKYNKLPPISFTPRTAEFKKLAVRRRDPIKQAPILYHDQLMTLMDSPRVKARDKALVSMMFDTMLRGFDIRQVQWQDVFTKQIDGQVRGFVRVYRTKGKYIPEGNVRALSSLTMKWLDKYHKRPPNKNYRHFPDSLIFPLSNTGIDKRFKLYSEVLGSKVTSHSPRVGATIEMIDKGISEVEIANVAGWSSTDMVRYYGRNQEAENSGMTKLFDKMQVEKNLNSSPDFVKGYGSDKSRSDRTA